MFAFSKAYFKKRYHRHYHPDHIHGSKHLFADVFLLTIIVLLSAFIVFLFGWYGRALVAERVDASLRLLTSEAQSGGEVAFEVSYANENADTILHDAFIEFLFPEGFTSIRSAPESVIGEKNSYPLGTLDPGQRGQFTISGKMIGDVGKDQHLRAFLNYKTDPRSIHFEKKLFFVIFSLTSSVFSFDVNMPSELVDKQEFDISIGYENTSSQFSQKNFRIFPVFPPAFEVLHSEPLLTDEGWIIDALDQREKGEIRIRGRMDAQGDKEKQFIFQSLIFENGRNQKQEEKVFTVPIRYPNVVFELFPQTRTLSSGQSQILNFTLRNNENKTLKNVEISFDSHPLMSFETPEGVALRSDAAKSVFVLRDVAVGETISGAFTLNTGTFKADEVLRFSGKEIGLSSHVSYSKEGEPARWKIPATPIFFKLSSVVGILGNARYFSLNGEQLGRGALPPEVGKKTKYWIFFELESFPNDIENVAVSSTLVPQVSFTGQSKAGGGEIRFDAQSRQLVWSLPNVNFGSRVGLAFEVEFSPEKVSQVNKPFPLVEDVTIIAKDRFTGEDIRGEGNDVLSVLE